MNQKKLQNCIPYFEEGLAAYLIALTGKYKTSVFSLISLLFVFSLSYSTAIAQHEVSGTVTDVEGDPLPGVTVMIEGTERGTTTDIDGTYSIEAAADATLIFSFVGFVRVEEEIAGRTTIDVVMEQTVAELQELIVTGYTAQRRADITGSVATVDVESMARQTSASALQRLDGRVSGVTVEASGSPGSRSTVRIRGISSFQNNEPLYIIDGTPVEDSFMNFLNPDDIADIQVLKDASAASIYGARASNGVVIIETRRGQEGAPRISVDMRFGRSSPAHRLDDILIQDAMEYAEVVRLAHVNAGEEVPRNIYGDPQNPSIPNYIWPNDGEVQTMDLSSQFGMTEDDYIWPDNLIMPASSGTNWFDAVFGSAFTHSYNVGISGGAESHRYNVSFNFMDQEGTAAYNRYQRGTIRVNTEFDIGNLTVGENMSLAVDEVVGGMPNDPGGFAEGGILGKNILMQPIVPVFDIGGNFASGKAVGLGNQTNPLKAAWANKDDPTSNTRLFGNVFARYDLADRFLLNTNFGFNLGETNWRGFSPMFPEDSEPTFTQSINEGVFRSRDWTWSNTINFVDTFEGVHNINALIGQEVNRVTTRTISGSMSGLITTDIYARFIDDAIGDPETQNVGSSGSAGTIASFFGKIDYNYDERYHLSFTLRRDGSSRLGPENRWGTFPAASVGWRVSGESFMEDLEFFTNLMIRIGWGITGNQNIPPGRTVDQFGGATGDTFYDIEGTGSNIEPGFRQSSLGNPELKWEENESINLGLDAEIFEGRVNFALDLYQRETDNLLFDPPTAATAGVASPPIVNIGQMRNRGFDVEIGYRGMVGDELSWSVNFNGGHYRNEILRIDGDTDSFFGPISTRFGTQVINQLGEPIGSFYGLIADGIFQNEAEVEAHVDQPGAAPGRIRFVDVNGDGEISAADRTIIGDPHPDFTAGLDIGLQWRNWDFSATLFGTFGNDIFDVQNEFYTFRNFNTNVRRELLTNSAVVENGEVINPDARFPRIDVSDTFSSEISSFFVEDGSYVRLRNIQVGFTVPPTIIPGFENLRIYFQGENLFTITGYSGLDPSIPAANISGPAGDIRDQARGIDRGSFPSNRTLSLGISAQF